MSDVERAIVLRQAQAVSIRHFVRRAEFLCAAIIDGDTCAETERDLADVLNSAASRAAHMPPPSIKRIRRFA